MALEIKIDTERVAACLARLDALTPDERQALWSRFFDAECAHCRRTRFAHLAGIACPTFHEPARLEVPRG